MSTSWFDAIVLSVIALMSIAAGVATENAGRAAPTAQVASGHLASAHLLLR